MSVFNKAQENDLYIAVVKLYLTSKIISIGNKLLFDCKINFVNLILAEQRHLQYIEENPKYVDALVEGYEILRPPK